MTTVDVPAGTVETETETEVEVTTDVMVPAGLSNVSRRDLTWDPTLRKRRGNTYDSGDAH
jgi:hypothetical protein